MWVEVQDDGTILHQHNVASVTHTGTGTYDVDSGTLNLSQCGAFATIGNPPPAAGPAAFIRADNTIGDLSKMTVWTYKKDGAATDYPFQLAVFC
jgi:hypothetical protein